MIKGTHSPWRWKVYKTISCHNYNNSSTIVYGCDIRKAQNFLRNCQNYAKAYFMMYSPTGYQELKTFDGVWKISSVKQILYLLVVHYRQNLKISRTFWQMWLKCGSTCKDHHACKSSMIAYCKCPILFGNISQSGERVHTIKHSMIVHKISYKCTCMLVMSVV